MANLSQALQSAREKLAAISISALPTLDVSSRTGSSRVDSTQALHSARDALLVPLPQLKHVRSSKSVTGGRGPASPGPRSSPAATSREKEFFAISSAASRGSNLGAIAPARDEGGRPPGAAALRGTRAAPPSADTATAKSDGLRGFAVPRASLGLVSRQQDASDAVEVSRPVAGLERLGRAGRGASGDARDGADALASDSTHFIGTSTSPASYAASVIHRPSLSAVSSFGLASPQLHPPQTAASVASRDTHIRVGVRLRPLIYTEVARDGVTFTQQPAWAIRPGVHVASDEDELADTVAVAEQEAEDPIDGLGGAMRNQVFRFRHVFGYSASNSQIYASLIEPVVSSAAAGMNGTIFAYGQTSSGKTHSIMGTADDPGLLVQAVHHLFELVAGRGSQFEYVVRVSYVEIYNEVVRDLLDRGNVNLRIVDDPLRGPSVRGVTERLVNDVDDVLATVAAGEANRHFGATAMNERSSRSHTVFRFNVECRPVSAGPKSTPVPSPARAAMASSASPAPRERRASVAGADADTILRAGISAFPARGRAGSVGSVGSTGETGVPALKLRSDEAAASPFASPLPSQDSTVTVSILNVIDLAGSERVGKTGATGDRLEEAKHINKSLHTLGNVIAALSLRSQGKRAPLPPFRDSKLTRLLSQSLGGNSLTALICCASPAARNREETRSTFEFATRAQMIVTRARVNTLHADKSLISAYREEIDNLRRQLEAALALQTQLSAVLQREKQMKVALEHKDLLLAETDSQRTAMLAKIAALEAEYARQRLQSVLPATARPRPLHDADSDDSGDDLRGTLASPLKTAAARRLRSLFRTQTLSALPTRSQARPGASVDGQQNSLRADRGPPPLNRMLSANGRRFMEAIAGLRAADDREAIAIAAARDTVKLGRQLRRAHTASTLVHAGQHAPLWDGQPGRTSRQPHVRAASVDFDMIPVRSSHRVASTDVGIQGAHRERTGGLDPLPESRERSGEHIEYDGSVSADSLSGDESVQSQQLHGGRRTGASAQNARSAGALARREHHGKAAGTTHIHSMPNILHGDGASRPEVPGTPRERHGDEAAVTDDGNRPAPEAPPPTLAWSASAPSQHSTHHTDSRRAGTAKPHVSALPDTTVGGLVPAPSPEPAEQNRPPHGGVRHISRPHSRPGSLSPPISELRLLDVENFPAGAPLDEHGRYSAHQASSGSGHSHGTPLAGGWVAPTQAGSAELAGGALPENRTGGGVRGARSADAHLPANSGRATATHQAEMTSDSSGHGSQSSTASPPAVAADQRTVELGQRSTAPGIGAQTSDGRRGASLGSEHAIASHSENTQAGHSLTSVTAGMPAERPAESAARMGSEKAQNTHRRTESEEARARVAQFIFAGPQYHAYLDAIGRGEVPAHTAATRAVAGASGGAKQVAEAAHCDSAASHAVHPDDAREQTNIPVNSTAAALPAIAEQAFIHSQVVTGTPAALPDAVAAITQPVRNATNAGAIADHSVRQVEMIPVAVFSDTAADAPQRAGTPAHESHFHALTTGKDAPLAPSAAVPSSAAVRTALAHATNPTSMPQRANAEQSSLVTAKLHGESDREAEPATRPRRSSIAATWPPPPSELRETSTYAPTEAPTRGHHKQAYLAAVERGAGTSLSSDIQNRGATSLPQHLASTGSDAPALDQQGRAVASHETAARVSAPVKDVIDTAEGKLAVGDFAETPAGAISQSRGGQSTCTAETRSDPQEVAAGIGASAEQSPTGNPDGTRDGRPSQENALASVLRGTGNDENLPSPAVQAVAAVREIPADRTSSGDQSAGGPSMSGGASQKRTADMQEWETNDNVSVDFSPTRAGLRGHQDVQAVAAAVRTGRNDNGARGADARSDTAASIAVSGMRSHASEDTDIVEGETANITRATAADALPPFLAVTAAGTGGPGVVHHSVSAGAMDTGDGRQSDAPEPTAAARQSAVTELWLQVQSLQRQVASYEEERRHGALEVPAPTLSVTKQAAAALDGRAMQASNHPFDPVPARLGPLRSSQTPAAPTVEAAQMEMQSENRAPNDVLIAAEETERLAAVCESLHAENAKLRAANGTLELRVEDLTSANERLATVVEQQAASESSSHNGNERDASMHDTVVSTLARMLQAMRTSAMQLHATSHHDVEQLVRTAVEVETVLVEHIAEAERRHAGQVNLSNEHSDDVPTPSAEALLHRWQMERADAAVDAARARADALEVALAHARAQAEDATVQLQAQLAAQRQQQERELEERCRLKEEAQRYATELAATTAQLQATEAALKASRAMCEELAAQPPAILAPKPSTSCAATSPLRGSGLRSCDAETDTMELDDEMARMATERDAWQSRCLEAQTLLEAEYRRSAEVHTTLVSQLQDTPPSLSALLDAVRDAAAANEASRALLDAGDGAPHVASSPP